MFKMNDTRMVSDEMNTRIFASIVLLGYDYLCTFNMPFVISVALCNSWLVLKTEALMRAH
jgi:hypothetical protein